ncbi:hypothetical protein [Sinorhizobium medicae]|uniref:hypothetical protein n=1 Tax=Sinorhizobium medicae TaxID=110321 RepID=UPI001AAEE650|nr:hypothetical protein [Sinorhizobium medicae]MBO1962970.1 hypothetical protein [Sinorhizobium medicae]WQP39311.1 hypothetical protein U8C38_06940 [Sinorhizobium medicae]
MSENPTESRPSLGELIVELVTALNHQHTLFDEAQEDGSDARDEVRDIVKKIDDLYGNRTPA